LVFVIDLKLQVPVAEEIKVDAETLAAIDRGIKAADEGQAVSLDEVREMIPAWISKFESHHRR
jgi:predicted transcriptional regulator